MSLREKPPLFRVFVLEHDIHLWIQVPPPTSICLTSLCLYFFVLFALFHLQIYIFFLSPCTTHTSTTIKGAYRYRKQCYIYEYDLHLRVNLPCLSFPIVTHTDPLARMMFIKMEIYTIRKTWVIYVFGSNHAKFFYLKLVGVMITNYYTAIQTMFSPFESSVKLQNVVHIAYYYGCYFTACTSWTSFDWYSQVIYIDIIKWLKV